MPIPYVTDCRESMDDVDRKVEQIRSALKVLGDYADEKTLSGKAADKWMAEFAARVKAAKACLETSIPEAQKACLKEAQRLQTASSAGS